MTQEELLTTAEIAARLRINEETVRRWGKAGCPHIDIGGNRRRYELGAVLAWLVAREKSTEPEPAS